MIQELLEKIKQQNQIIEAQGQAIAQLQAQNEQHVRAIAQLQTLLPPSADFMPPGWDAEVWRKLPAPDKRHFCYLSRRRRFRPSQQGQGEAPALPAVTAEQMKQKQKDELQRLVGKVSPEQKQQLEAAKFEALRDFWSQAPEEDQRNMPF
ncbi:hypothetical protein I8748_32595 [Nostoc sp. CENA67]|uniref:Uncharacterized protein n=1 Tax=Amazonocrinis nigriterrae CENA67 TaxID=2794033 RepID=A0A8J7HVM4_9NOST|nr:hypothetical protein [Amazonocrinis nigriterrae]MBH8566833.1 hypothetical protein [Amazonocrinis nigriterrae CENA67]